MTARSHTRSRRRARARALRARYDRERRMASKQQPTRRQSPVPEFRGTPAVTPRTDRFGIRSQPESHPPMTTNPDPIAEAIADAAKDAGARDPADVLALADRAAIATADDGTVLGAAEAVADLQKRSAYLFKSPPPAANFDAGPRGDGTSGRGITHRSQLRGMSPERIEQLRQSGQLDYLMGGGR